MQVDIPHPRIGREEGHGVKGSQQDPAIQQVEVDESVEEAILRRHRVAAVPRRSRDEPVLHARARTDDGPRRPMHVDRASDAAFKRLGERYHAPVGPRRDDVGEGGSHRRERKRVARKRSADAAVIGFFAFDLGQGGANDVRSDTERSRGDPAANCFPQGDQIGFQMVCPGVSRWTFAQRVRFIQDQQGSVPTCYAT